VSEELVAERLVDGVAARLGVLAELVSRGVDFAKRVEDVERFLSSVYVVATGSPRR
jgi:hypothetical protein